ncbi:MAG: hypothetical protein ACK4QW_12620 [Alphaproteobacteria bacterium]
MIEAGRIGGLAQAVRGLVLLVAVCILATAAARADDAYLVERVPVDVTAANAAEARDRALDEAYGKAFDVLVERLGASRPRGVNPADLSLSIEIAEERVTAVRYSAAISVQFDPARVSAALGRPLDPAFAAGPGSAIPGPIGGPTMALGAPILVVPVYEWSGTRTLWETSNPWYQAWQRARPRILTGEAVLPEGSSADRNALTADIALGGDRDVLLRMARDGYRADNAIVVLGRYEVDHAAGQPVFHVIAAGHGPQMGGRRLDLRVPGDANTFVDDLAEKAVAETVARIDATWQAGVPMASTGDDRPFRPDGPERDILVTAALSGPADLARLRGRIGSLPMVTRDQIVSLSRREAVLRVHYAGDSEGLRNALSDAGFAVSSESGGWLVRPNGEAGIRPSDQQPRPLPGR